MITTLVLKDEKIISSNQFSDHFNDFYLEYKFNFLLKCIYSHG